MDRDTAIKTVSNNFFLVFLTHPKYRLYRHLLLILFIGLALYSRKATFVECIIALAMLLALFYVNMYWLVPRFLFKEKYSGYSIRVFLLILLFGGILIMGTFLLRPDKAPSNDIRAIALRLFSFSFLIIVLIAASAAIKLFQRWIIDTERISELEKITIQSELQQLKTQINPHFLFNTLNNINVLTQKDPEKASQVVMKLSDLLRYQLYDSARNKVLLTADIHFLTDFLNLEKIRRDHFDFLVLKEGDISGVQVPPLLFIAFVENAVKHNMDSERPSYVHLFFSVQNGELNFTCRNSKPQTAVAKKVAGGLGLVNVKRTLELLYPDKHHLRIVNEANAYHVTLTIRL